jgi:DNA-binding transcriptional ArsR family regulator
MKRSPDLLRELLLHYEDKANDRMDSSPSIDGFSKLEVDYHLILMYEAGLVRAEPVLSKMGRLIRVHPFSLTWQGHELLDAARNTTTWKRVKKQVLSKTGSVSIELLKTALIAYAKDKVGLAGA